jgi:putative sigma-54 modulation protein
MRMEIRSQSRVSIKLRGSIERRLRFVLARFGSRVNRVTVRLAEVNGARGEAAKLCKVVVQLVPRGMVCVEETDTDFQTVADRATGRVGRAVGRELERRNAAKAANTAELNTEEPP